MALGSRCYGGGALGSSAVGEGIVNYLMIAYPGSFYITMGQMPVSEVDVGVDKLGYINNPRWTEEPASLTEHSPCGYWFRGAGKGGTPVWKMPK